VAGVQLNNNTATETRSERRFLNSKPVEFSRNITKTRRNSLKNGETVAGVELNNNTASTKKTNEDLYDVKPVEFSREKKNENEELFAAKWRELWLE
jgi:hypothetical protein